jgi:hypothetical protein
MVMVENHLDMTSPSQSPKGGATGGGREVVVCGEGAPTPQYIGGAAAPMGAPIFSTFLSGAYAHALF